MCGCKCHTDDGCRGIVRQVTDLTWRHVRTYTYPYLLHPYVGSCGFPTVCALYALVDTKHQVVYSRLGMQNATHHYSTTLAVVVPELCQ
ncbi:hypothetical protein J6590_102986 [Homalodisca vitripennis]|nr:hypothetical protein J6590_102986 [Homalodisca vitripennis]